MAFSTHSLLCLFCAIAPVFELVVLQCFLRGTRYVTTDELVLRILFGELLKNLLLMVGVFYSFSSCWLVGSSFAVVGGLDFLALVRFLLSFFARNARFARWLLLGLFGGFFRSFRRFFMLHSIVSALDFNLRFDSTTALFCSLIFKILLLFNHSFNFSILKKFASRSLG